MAPLIFLAVAYLTAVLVVNRRHPRQRWPLARTGSFLLGLFLVGFATQGQVAVYDDVLFSMHMAQHLLLVMAAPPLLVYACPITLALHASRNPWHTRLKRVLRSRPVTAATSAPLVAAVYVAVIVGTHLTGFMNLVLAHPLVHDSEHVLYLVTGYLFFLPIVGSEPQRSRPSLAMRYALLFLAMPVDTFVGIALMMSPYELFPGYAHTGRTWGQSPVGDLHTGGAIMWVGGDAGMSALIVLLTVGLVRNRDAQRILGPWIEGARIRTMHEQFSGRGVTAPLPQGATVDEEAHLIAYNSYLEALHGRDSN